MDEKPKSALLWIYLKLSPVIRLFARRHLERRIIRGKEHPLRYREKLGLTEAPRPDGTLIWMHAVGVGEVLALPGLIREMLALEPALNVLLTSSTRTSADAIKHNLPPRTIHQFLPLDSPHYVKRFLDHWQPQLSVWAERDIWPAFLAEIERRQIPLALINGRMSVASGDSKQKTKGFFATLYAKFAFIEVQDEISAEQFTRLGVDPAKISVTAPLKSGADPLADQPEPRKALQDALNDRPLWLAASTHAEDEIEVFKAHTKLLERHPDTLLILAPRAPERAKRIQKHARDLGFTARILQDGDDLSGTQIAIIDRIGELGIWYRLADRCFVGGSFGAVGGHNPYEPALLDCAISHGPDLQSFKDDYAGFHNANAATLVNNADELANTLLDPAFLNTRNAAKRIAKRGKLAIATTAQRLHTLLHSLDK
ncbi:3-deoxy-D-manno-octulosonic acid transferase [Profundibacter sp.]